MRYFPICDQIVILNLVYYSLSQSLPAPSLAIQNISVLLNVDLYQIAAFGDYFSNFVSWKIHDTGIGGAEPASLTFNETVEIMDGSAEEHGNTVVDIAGQYSLLPKATFFQVKDYLIPGTNALDHNVIYGFPTSLPLGLYHYRINSSVHSDGVFVTDLTARSPTINVSTSQPIGCVNSTPPPYYNISSPKSPKFTSLYTYKPSAGSNLSPDDENTTSIYWSYRDGRSSDDNGIHGISYFSVQVINAATLEPIGGSMQPTIADDWSIGMLIQVPNIPLVFEGTYKLVVKYTNAFQDGQVPPGEIVTYTSEMFTWVTNDDWLDDCASLAAKEKAGPGSISPGSSGQPDTHQSSNNSMMMNTPGSMFMFIDLLMMSLGVPYVPNWFI
ncbi:hypothetical protein H0H93_001544 [Arthromyces matolae]|nr:hypothetical protein H0H93_001544 [Arthromyces matolae]